MQSSGEKKIRTRNRILEAAGELFATKGYDATKVREICDRASANIALVNYYFRDKRGLFQELLKEIGNDVRKNYIDVINDQSELMLKERLYNFVYQYLFRRLNPERSEWRILLFHNELMNSSSYILPVFREMLKKERQILKKIIQDALGIENAIENANKADRELVEFCWQSILGQVSFFFHVHGPVLHNLLKKITLKDKDNQITQEKIEDFSRHITEFSLSALEHFRIERKKVLK